MFHDESWKSIYVGVKSSKVTATSHKNFAFVGFCTLVSAVFFSSITSGWLTLSAIKESISLGTQLSTFCGYYQQANLHLYLQHITAEPKI